MIMIMESDDQPHDQVLGIDNPFAGGTLRFKKSRALIRT